MTRQKDYQTSVDHGPLKLSKVKPCVRVDYCAVGPQLMTVQFTMVKKQYTFSGKHTLNFDLFPGCDVGGILSGDAGQ